MRMRRVAALVLATTSACGDGGAASPSGDVDVPLAFRSVTGGDAGAARPAKSALVSLPPAGSTEAFVQIFTTEVRCEVRALDATYRASGIVLEMWLASWPARVGDAAAGTTREPAFVDGTLARVPADGYADVVAASPVDGDLRIRFEGGGLRAEGRIRAVLCP